MVVQHSHYNLLGIPENTVPAPILDILFDDSETLPTNCGEGSIAYCYKGTDKGKYFIFDGTEWVEQ